MRLWLKVGLGAAALALVGAGAFACLLYQTPHGVWASEPGQAVFGAVMRTASPAAAGTPKVRKGDPLPLVTVHALDGSPVTLAATPGRKTLVNFWASWCGPCIAEMPIIDAASKGPLGRRLAVVGVSVDAALPTVVEHLKERPVSYRILWDPASPSNAQARLGGSKGPALPYSVLVDEHGRIEKTRFMGFDDEAELERWAF